MEYIKIYLKPINSEEILEKVVEVSEVSHYVSMGWTLEKPEKKVEKTEKVFLKKDQKKENSKNV